MSNLKKGIVILLLAMTVVVASTLVYGSFLLNQHHPLPGAEVVVDIPPGYGSEEIVEVLVENGILGNRLSVLAYLYFSPYRGRLQAGEYLFDEPMNVEGVFQKLSGGDVRLYTLTIPEGLRVDQIALRWEEAGFGASEDFLNASNAAFANVLEINADAVSIEGYLFPETYSFPREVTAAEAVDAMIRGFQDTVRRLEESVDRSEWPLDLNDVLVLASLIESEAAVADERAVISSVFHNRLARSVKLDCDPTVVYALIQDGNYRGRLLREDLTFDSPYNTYVYGGLPPGAISNPGFASLLAAIQPDESAYMFFVRAEGGRHAFSRTLAEHNRAVAAYRRIQE
jgi:UPF0755 protein